MAYEPEPDWFGGTATASPSQEAEPDWFSASPQQSPASPEQSPLDLMRQTAQMNQTLGIDSYQFNQQQAVALDNENNPRGAISGSLPYRTVETAVESLGGKGVSMLSGVEGRIAEAFGANDVADELYTARERAQGTMKQDALDQAIADKKGWLGETLTSWTRQGGSSVLESVPIAAAGGLAGVASAFAASTFDEKLAEGASAGEAASHGLIEGAFTMLGGKLLGSGLGKLAGKLGGGEVAEGLSGKVAQYVSKKLPINETLARITTAAGAEAAEEFSTEVAHYLVDVANDREKFSPERMWDRAKGAIGPALIAGGIGDAAIHLGGVIGERQRDLPTIAKAIEAAQSVASDIRQKLTASDVTPSRREFAKVTGESKTSETYRDAFVDELRRMNEEAARAAETESEAGPMPELTGERYPRKPLTPDELKAHNKEIRRMRREGVSEDTLTDFERLDSRIGSDLLSKASEIAQAKNEQLAEIRSEYLSLVPPEMRGKVRQRERQGLDADKVFRFDQKTQALSDGEYPSLAQEASNRGNGDLEAGLRNIVVTGGAKNFDPVSADSFLADVLDEYRGSQRAEAPLESAPPSDDAAVAPERQPVGVGPLALGMNPKVQELGRKLANIAQTPRERDYLAELDKVATEAGEPGIKHDADVKQAAMYRLEADPARERAKIMEQAKRGGQLNDEDTLIAKQLFQDEAYEALRLGDEQKLAEVSALRDAYRATGTEQARAFRQRHDPLGGKTIMEATPKERLGAMTDELFDRTPAERKRHEKAVKSRDTAELERINKEQASRLKRIEKQLNALGLSLDQLPTIAKDPVSTAKVRAQIGAANKTFQDKLHEYWISMGLLSGAKTQAANIGGNLLHGVYDYAFQAPTEATINALMKSIGVGDPAGRHLGELPRLWGGIRQGIAQGWRNALITWKTEAPVTAVDDKFDHAAVAIGGKAGRGIRAPLRLLSAADEFFNTLFANVEVGGAAFRTGVLKGLSGPELESYIHNEVTTPDSLSWRLALKHASELTFHQELSGVSGRALNAARSVRNVGPMRWFMPFISFAAKSTSTALRKMPVTGDIAMMKAAYDNFQAGRPPSFGMSRRFAERAIAWGTVVALASTIDDDDPWITGASTAPQGAPKSSIRINGQWFSYARIEPFATMLGATVDGIMSAKTGSLDQAAKNILVEIPASQVASKTFLQGLSDVMELLPYGQNSHEPMTDKLVKYFARFGETFVPNFYRQLVGASRDTQPDTRVFGRSTGEKVAVAAKRMAENLLPIKYEAKIDPWGRPLPSGQAPFWSAPLTDFGYRLLSPAYQAPDQPTRGDKLIARWNAEHPDEKPKSLNPPSPYFKINGKRYSLTPEEYEEYQVMAGKMANAIVSRIPDQEHPTDATMKRIDDALDDGRTAAKGRLMAKWRANHRPTRTVSPPPKPELAAAP